MKDLVNVYSFGCPWKSMDLKMVNILEIKYLSYVKIEKSRSNNK
jgi:hypothetical protein